MNVLFIRREFVVERFGNGERTVRKFVIGFERTRVKGASYAMRQRAREMQDHPAFARSKRFVSRKDERNPTELLAQ